MEEIWLWASAIVGVAILGAAFVGARQDRLAVDEDAGGGLVGGTDWDGFCFDDLDWGDRVESTAVSM